MSVKRAVITKDLGEGDRIQFVDKSPVTSSENQSIIKIALWALGILVSANSFFIARVVSSVDTSSGSVISLVEQVKAMKELQNIAATTDKELQLEVKNLEQMTGELKVLNYAVEQINGKCSIKPPAVTVIPPQ